jgi:hypothetical protein
LIAFINNILNLADDEFVKLFLAEDKKAVALSKIKS